ncbi:MAG: lipopolysaccharide biosynthesis protein [Crocinitomicaceae bacterium]|jgi:LPS O-antigen subunit length determinant protein (WzzB/FepE family)|nr:lipopolysaccharide biosynthesis protein [Crocinitomicaceae bacterium]
MEKNENLESGRIDFLLFIWKKRKIISIITLSAAIITTAYTFLMTPLFLSTAIVFPAATSTVSFSGMPKASSMDFGEEEQAEQLVQILSSSRIRDLLVRRYNLMEHYNIGKNDANKNYKLNQAYSEHIHFERTKYGSIQIDVLDRDRFLAAEIANKIVDLIDTVKNQMVKERTLPAFGINKRKLQLLRVSLKEINNKLDSLSKIGVVHTETRANILQAYNEANNAEDKAYFKKQMEINIKHGAEFDGLSMVRNEKLISIAKFEDTYEQAESDANTELPHKFIVERAVVADKKEKPKKAVIILVVTFATFILSIFGLLVQDRVKELRKIA